MANVAIFKNPDSGDFPGSLNLMYQSPLHPLIIQQLFAEYMLCASYASKG